MAESRLEQALATRVAAAKLAASRPHPRHIANGDEQKFRHDAKTSLNSKGVPIPDNKDKPSYLGSYTKGLPHNAHSGLIENPDDFQYFVRGIDSGDPRDFRDTPLGHPENRFSTVYKCPQFKWRSAKAQSLPKGGGKGQPADVRAWESAGAGLAFSLEGPDAQAVTMPPAPALGSDELTAEMGEVYVQALLRDTPFTAMSLGTKPPPTAGKLVNDRVNDLGRLPWFDASVDLDLGPAESSRRRTNLGPHTAFRGITPGDDIGPYISQFLLVGHSGINPNDNEPNREPANGLISYGAVTIDQRVRVARPEEDHMTIWDEWIDVQNGANLGAQENYVEAGIPRRFITTPRDLATYVHYDALYEAYLNACLILLGNGFPFDPGIPFQEKDKIDHQQGFAHFGGPHILSLLTEVATRALKAVRFQKFNIHRRLRPEALAGRLEKVNQLGDSSPELKTMNNELKDILAHVFEHNKTQNQGKYKKARNKKGTHLLPMAFCEGSPMHPAYGAGHATVAGACVTILKAFFDHKHPLAVVPQKDAGVAYVPTHDGAHLTEAKVFGANRNPASLTVEGELNKLASNISIGRDWAGVHYFTDYIESLRMGEQIAIGILEEQKLLYRENFSMTIPLFDGGSIRI